MTDTFIHIWRLLNPSYEYSTQGREQACRRLWESFDLERQRYTYQTIRDRQRRGDDYPAIKKACERMYKDFLPVFGAKFAKMQKAIVYWYCNKRLPPELDLFCDKLPQEYKKDNP